MAAVYTFLLFTLLQEGFSLNSFQFIEKHKSLINSSVTVLKSNGDKTVLQYEYVIANNQSIKTAAVNGTTLIVGFLQNADLLFDCNYKQNGLFEGYSFKVLQKLQELLKFE